MTLRRRPTAAMGLARFDERGWDLVLTDLGMPEMSGWEVVEAIRRRVPNHADRPDYGADWPRA